MTVLQETVGTKSDRGRIGFEPGPSRQFLIFPKSLRSFAGKTVIGIKYDLLKVEKVSKKDRAPAPHARKKTKTKHRGEKRTPNFAHAAHKNVVAFKSEEPGEEENEEAVRSERSHLVFYLTEQNNWFRLIWRIVLIRRA